MNVEYINPFLQAAKHVLKSIINIEPTICNPFVKSNPYRAGEICANIGLTGKIKGQAVITMDYSTAKQLASSMMFGFEIQDAEIVRSAIAELTNMVLGNASSAFASKKIFVDITPPTLMSGKDIIIYSKNPTISIPVILEGIGRFELDISFEENKAVA